LAGERILVVDDDPVISRFLSALLSEDGYTVQLSREAEHAMELAQQFTFDLILGELLMPFRDRASLLLAFRQEERVARTPLIVLSVRDAEEEIVRGLEDGADDYVVKPFRARELLARVRKALDRPKPSR
jgi:DNA-binding response OmpR family regulator